MATTAIGLASFIAGSPPVQGRETLTATGTGTVSGWLDSVWEVREGAIKTIASTNCKNCGAAYNRWDDDCNYCGTIRI